MFGFVKKYKLLIIIAILALVGAALYQFALTDDSGNLTFIAEDSGVLGSAVGREVVALIDELALININGEVFNDPVFKALIDFQEGVSRESIGRSNPFAPIGSGGGAVGFIELPLERIGDPLPTPPKAEDTSLFRDGVSTGRDSGTSTETTGAETIE